MVGANAEGDALIEDVGDPIVLLEGDRACGSSMVCMPSLVGECL